MCPEVCKASDTELITLLLDDEALDMSLFDKPLEASILDTELWEDREEAELSLASALLTLAKLDVLVEPIGLTELSELSELTELAELTELTEISELTELADITDPVDTTELANVFFDEPPPPQAATKESKLRTNKLLTAARKILDIAIQRVPFCGDL